MKKSLVIFAGIMFIISFVVSGILAQTTTNQSKTTPGNASKTKIMDLKSRKQAVKKVLAKEKQKVNQKIKSISQQVQQKARTIQKKIQKEDPKIQELRAKMVAEMKALEKKMQEEKKKIQEKYNLLIKELSQQNQTGTSTASDTATTTSSQ